MNLYEKCVQDELAKWRNEIYKSDNLVERTSKAIQKKTSRLIPQKVQNMLTQTIEKLVETVIFGSGLLTVYEDTHDLSLAERDFLVLRQFKAYKKAAIAGGFGIGMGGILVGLADLPVLISIKIKFLFDCAKLYGYDTDLKSERMFILYIFQLAFSSRAHRVDSYKVIENWDGQPMDEVNWERFQIEYRDYIDFAKLLQLVPVIGSAVGATANNSLMKRLLVNAMNAYRMRYLKQNEESKVKIDDCLL
ncbi:EcsC family protein [Lachnospiraceae bacterium ZAX-1]